MFKFELYCGLESNSDLNILESFNKASEYLFQQAANLELDISLLHMEGSFTNNNKDTIIEDGILVIVLAEKRFKKRVRELGNIYKNKYHQQSVFFVETEIKVEFI